MSKPITLTFTFPHNLGADEVRRRLDRHTAWAFKQFAKEKIAIEADDWFGKRRAAEAILGACPMVAVVEGKLFETEKGREFSVVRDHPLA